MRARQAVKLHRGDEVRVRVAPKQWLPGVILEGPFKTEWCPKSVFVSVLLDTGAFLQDVLHTDLR